MGGCLLVAAPYAWPALERSWCIRWAERGIGNKNPVILQPVAATIRAVPDRNGTDGDGSEQVHLPPGIGIRIGRGNRTVIEVTVRVTIDRSSRARGGAGKSAALG